MKTPRNPKGAGRPPENRVRAALFIKSEALKDLDSRAVASTRGKVVERLLSQVPPVVPAP